MPPSTSSSLPATKLLSSEARNSIAAAISSGRAMRPSGMFAACLARTAAASSDELTSASISGVSQGPGVDAAVLVQTQAPALVARRDGQFSAVTADRTWQYCSFPERIRENDDGSPGFDGDLHPGGRDRVLLRRRTAASRRAAGGLEDGRPARNLSGCQAAHAFDTRTDTNRGGTRLFRTRQTRDRGGG